MYIYIYIRKYIYVYIKICDIHIIICVYAVKFGVASFLVEKNTTMNFTKK